MPDMSIDDWKRGCEFDDVEMEMLEWWTALHGLFHEAKVVTPSAPSLKREKQVKEGTFDYS
jgi:hypothetical protein